jgi:steroid delta-isomerase-like uncharacterized protein
MNQPPAIPAQHPAATCMPRRAQPAGSTTRTWPETHQEKSTAMTPSQNAQTVLDMLDAAWNHGDMSAVERSVADQHVEHEPDGDDIGRQRLADAVLAYRTAFPDLRMSFEDQITEQDQVVTRWTARGTHHGELNGIPATGRPAHVSGIFIHRLADGQITESWTSYDQLGLLRQLGIIPAAGPA